MNILDIISELVYWILPIYTLLIVLKLIFIDFHILHKPNNNIQAIKILIGIFILMPIIFCVLIVSTTNIITIAQSIEQYEIEESKIFPNWVQELIYICIIFIWSLIGVVVHNYIYNKLCYTQIIPGVGSIKKRVIEHIFNLKKLLSKTEVSDQ